MNSYSKKNIYSSLLDRSAGKFYHAWESEKPELRQDVIRKKLSETIHFAVENSAFYRQRLADFNVQDEHPLAKVPVLHAQDLRAELPPAGAQMLAQESGYYTVFQSGGTTGMPKSSLFGSAEILQLDELNARGFYALGLRSEDRVANLWAVGGLYMTFIHMNQMLQSYGCMNFPFSNQTPVEFIHNVAKLYQINCFTGITSVVLNALREMDRNEAGSLRINKIYYGGEHIYESDKEELRKKFGTEIVGAPGYGTVDTWYIGYQCLDNPTGVFHAHDDQVYLEIVDEETGKHCVGGEIGMAYVTAFPRRVTPIVRYRVGDRAHWMNQPCSCGRTTPLFRLLGRGDDVLRIGYDSVDYEFIQNAVSRFSELSSSVQMQKKRVEGRDQLILRVESSADSSQFLNLSKLLENYILDARPSLRDFIKKESIHPLRIEILLPGKIPLNPRTGKLIRVIDAL